MSSDSNSIKVHSPESYALSIDDLKKLIPGDTIVVNGHEFSIVKTGRRWLTLNKNSRPIDITTGRLKPSEYGSKADYEIFRDLNAFNHAQAIVTKRIKVRDALSFLKSNPSKISDDLYNDLFDVFEKHKSIR